MDKEKEQELEWVEAQKLEINVDLISAAKQQLQFLATVDQNRWLYEGPLLLRSIYRYNACWLPLLAKYTESPIRENSLVPPLDCEWIWHCHRLNPVRYKSDCEQLYGKVLDNCDVVSSINGNFKRQTEDIWNRLYPEELYDLDLDEAISEDVSEKLSALEECTKYDLVSAVKRQSPFYYQVSRPHVNNDIFLEEAVARYKGFLYLIKKNGERSIKRFCVPTYDIDLIWHTHQLHPLSYCKDLEKAIGKVLEHDDTDSDRKKGKKLDNGFSGTTAQWEETFGRRYWKAGAMYRGSTPAPVTIVPFASDSSGKELALDSEYQNVIQFPEVEAIEVMLEIIGVKNLPDGHKGKLSVVFSKTQPDSLFHSERRLAVLSESGQKQVDLFQCELTGELCFRLTNEDKDLGFASLSLREFLFPVAKLSVEKWLELAPPSNRNTDSKAVFLRVAVSFTPPIRRPSLLHMVQSGSSLRGSCFPMLQKARLAKSSTLIIDDTRAEVISLQMSAKRQVIGVKESGETLKLAEFNGTFWSLLNSKWSLEYTNGRGEDGPLFQLLGSHVVKVFSGRRLDYEPKHCRGQRSDRDFMTAVEFSKQHPYGTAVGLLDLKLCCFEAKENWLVFPGIVSAFILDAISKKEGFGCRTKDEIINSETLEGNGLMEDSNQIKLRTTTEEAETKLEASNTETVIMGSGYGGGFGNMVEAGEYAGCGGGSCSGECGNTVMAAESAGCGGGCGGGCGNMVKAAESAGCGGSCGGGCGVGCGGSCGGGCATAETEATGD